MLWEKLSEKSSLAIVLRNLWKHFAFFFVNFVRDDEDMKPAKTVLTILKDWILMEYGSDFSENPELVNQIKVRPLFFF